MNAKVQASLRFPVQNSSYSTTQHGGLRILNSMMCKRCQGKGSKSYSSHQSESIIFKRDIRYDKSPASAESYGGHCYYIYRWWVPCPACRYGDSMEVPLTELYHDIRTDMGIDHIE